MNIQIPILLSEAPFARLSGVGRSRLTRLVRDGALRPAAVERATGGRLLPKFTEDQAAVVRQQLRGATSTTTSS